MTTERSIWLAEHRATTEALTPAVCACGQDLDCSTRHHCPRCGIRVAVPAAA